MPVHYSIVEMDINTPSSEAWLSETLNEGLGNLTSLEILDLNDNDLKGTVPDSTGLLVHLKRLRLSYNSLLTGSVPQSLEQLNQLDLLHIHGNRLTGSMPTVHLSGLTDTSSFITDCGVPSDFDLTFFCSNCTMCCNLDGECESTAFPKLLQVDKYGFCSYAELTLVFVLSLIGVVCLVVLLSSLYDSAHKKRSRLSILQLDKKYALDNIGTGALTTLLQYPPWFTLF
jgi:Leucine-rich repeat (LRR) protein